MRISLIVLAVLVFVAPGAAQQAPAAERIRLWEGEAPGAQGSADEDIPTLDLYPAAAAQSVGTAVVVLPGGGYRNLAMDHEGVQIARWWNERGVSAFVLRYRLGPKYNHPVEIGDAQRAIRWVRSRAQTYGFEADRVGVMGFSAGGHLASTAATLFEGGDPTAADPIDRVDARPDFAVLMYPVISMNTEFAHQGSKRNLLGEMPDEELAEYLSTDRRVTDRTPPTFLFHTSDDPVVPAQNSVLFYQALRRHGVPAELHIYEHGRHGVGLAADDPVLGTWPARLEDWMRVRGLLPAQ